MPLYLPSPLSVALGGTGYTGGAWTSYNATVVPASGSITTQVSDAAYFVIGKFCAFQFYVTVSNIGTGVGPPTITLPFAPKRNGFASGREAALSGQMFALVYGAGSTAAGIFKFDNTAVSFANGAIYAGYGVFELP